MNILITGGFGYLGSYLSKYFEEQGFNVYILEKNISNSPQNSKYTIIEADICDLKVLKQKLDFQIDYCIHAAAAADFFIKDYYKIALDVNTLGTRNLLEILKNKNLKKFIYISTIHIYGNQTEKIITEKLLPNPINDYALTHLFAEYYTRQYNQNFNFPYVIFRLTNSYAAPLSYNSTKWYLVLNDLVKTAFDQNKIKLNSNGAATRDFIWQKNVAKIIEQSFENNNIINDTYNLCSEKNYSIIQIAEKVQKVFSEIYKKNVPLIINSQDKKEYKEYNISGEKLKSLINYQIDDKIEEEIKNTINLLNAQK